MSLFQSFSKSLAIQGRALGFLFSNGMAWMLLIPVALFVGMAFLGVVSFGELARAASESLLVEDWSFLVPFLVIFFKLLFFIVFGMWGGYLIVIIMSPFMAYVSEKTEQLIDGKETPFDLIQIIKDVVRGILLALRNCFMELLIGILIFFGAFVPIVGPIVSSLLGTVFLFFVSAYFYGFSFIDYTNERRRLSVRESVNFVKKNKGMAVGHGFLFALVLYIPLVGPFLSAFLAITSTVAATIEMVELREKSV